MMKALVVALMALAAGASTETLPGRARTEAELAAVVQALVAGLAAGDWTPWERQTLDGLLYTTELGRTLTKRELRALFARAAPEGRKTLTVTTIASRSRGGTAVLVGDLVAGDEDGDVQRYRVTGTFWRVGGSWRAVSLHVTEVATEADEEIP